MGRGLRVGREGRGKLNSRNVGTLGGEEIEVEFSALGIPFLKGRMVRG